MNVLVSLSLNNQNSQIYPVFTAKPLISAVKEGSCGPRNITFRVCYRVLLSIWLQEGIQKVNIGPKPDLSSENEEQEQKQLQLQRQELELDVARSSHAKKGCLYSGWI